MHAWWRTADFGFVKKVQDDLATVCEAHDQVYDHNSQTWYMCNNFELSVPVYKLSINKLVFVGSDAIKKYKANLLFSMQGWVVAK
jgi:hypothetical protein